MRKPLKIILLSFLGLFLLSLFFIGYASYTAISSCNDRPQWEEHLTEWDYFFAWSTMSLIVNVVLCLITLGVYFIINWALRLRRRAFVNQASCLYR